MEKKIKSKGNQAFNIPNTEEGRKALKTIKHYSQNTKFRAVGRGGNRKENGGNAAYIPLENAEWWAVYTDTVTKETHEKLWIKYYKLKNERNDSLKVAGLQGEIEGLSQELAMYKERYGELSIADVICHHIDQGNDELAKNMVRNNI